jgi:hypothetical protein
MYSTALSAKFSIWAGFSINKTRPDDLLLQNCAMVWSSSPLWRPDLLEHHTVDRRGAEGGMAGGGERQASAEYKCSAVWYNYAFDHVARKPVPLALPTVRPLLHLYRLRRP